MAKLTTTLPSDAGLVEIPVRAFANDPVRSPRRRVPAEDVCDLKDNNFLTTALLDYIIGYGMPKDIPDEVLIGSSNSMQYFELMNTKDINSNNKTDAKIAQTLRRKYQFYSLRRYHFMAVNCASWHFIVMSVKFDPHSTEIFEEVRVYDSYRRSARRKESVFPSTVPAEFLCHFQLFLAKFCFFGTKQGELLLREPRLILQDAAFLKCPQQQNKYDCGLFGLATLLHLVHGRDPTSMEYSQDHITELRHGLYETLSHRRRRLLYPNFLCSYFPSLKELVPDNVDEYIQKVLEEPSSDEESLGDDGDIVEVIGTVDTSASVHNTASIGDTPTQIQHSVSAKEEGTVEADEYLHDQMDSVFARIFVDEPKNYETLGEVEELIHLYEKETGYRLVICKSNDHSRTYVCRSHIDCTFRARFGPKRGTDDIVLKTTMTNMLHNGKKAPPTAKGRAYKKRLKGRFDFVVDHVATVKDAKPVAKDIMKAAATLIDENPTYNQSYRVVRGVALRKWEEDDISFQMMKPYLEKFKDLNPESTTMCQLDGNHLERVFVCPGMMKASLRHVRPVMSLDAAHLKSRWKGTLYTASVQTGCNSIYPVAVGITTGNESESGWTWFLELLYASLEILVMDWPDGRYRYKYFTFMSDRQKGLIEALRMVFPDNHSCYCAIHIARNSEKHGGKRLSRMVHNLAKTFSHFVSTNILDNMKKVSPKGAAYIEGIPPNQWRSTSWRDDPGLPPRYGIVTSNMSEATNNMFEGAREGSWLYALDYMLGKMMERITVLRNSVKGEDGVLSNIVSLIQTNWEACSGSKVLEVDSEGQRFTIIRRTTRAEESTTRYNIDLGTKKCTCGEWQDNGYPCIDAMAYFRLQEKMTMNEVLERQVDARYTYASERALLSVNILPVCMDTIAPDGVTLPPKQSLKRSSGRPKKLRLRSKRSRFAANPEESPVVCSKCHQKGHNVRTCDARKWLAKQDEKKKKRDGGGPNDDDKGNGGGQNDEDNMDLLDLS